MAPSPSLLVSTALDRYCRVHSSFPPPTEAGNSQECKGEVVEKIFMTSIPTAVVWDGVEPIQPPSQANAEDDDDVWNEMENAQDEDSDDESNRRKKRQNVQ